MTITHNGFSFTGIAEEIDFGEWERQVQYVSSFGNKGASQLDGLRTTRNFSVRVYMFGVGSLGASAAAMIAFLGTCETKIGAVGTFVDDGLQARTIKNVEFIGIKLEEGPLPTAPDGGWIAIVMLSFKQLSP